MYDVKNSKESIQGFAESWDKQVRELWPESYPASLSKAFKEFNVSSILDCAGGTGYPSIELKKMGWDISYSDGSETLLSFFKKRTEVEKLDIPTHYARWEELTQNTPRTYDALMCAGNSFIGINSYDDFLTTSKEEVTRSMKKALSEFYNALNPNGVLYIDVFNEKYSCPTEPFSVSSETDTHLSFTTICYDKERHIRTNLTTTTSLIDGTEEDSITKFIHSPDGDLTVYLEGNGRVFKYIPVYVEELTKLLKEAGFSRVEFANTDDAGYVDSLFAFKD
jgi:SAM-dependent methyltransferase